MLHHQIKVAQAFPLIAEGGRISGTPYPKQPESLKAV